MSLRRGPFGVRWAVSDAVPPDEGGDGLLTPTHYVSPTGSASWANATNPATPCSAATAMTNAVADNVVQFAAGTYSVVGTDNRWTPALNPSSSGTLGHPITFQANGTVTITFSSGTGPAIGADGRDYITWNGFAVDEANAPGASDTGPCVFHLSTGGVVKNCTLDGNGGTSPYDNHPGVRLQDAYDVTVENNTIHDFYNPDSSSNGCGIQVYWSGRVTIRHNTIYNCFTGIFVKQLEGYPDTPGDVVGDFSIYQNYIHNCTVVLSSHHAPCPVGGPVRFYQNLCVAETDGVVGWQVNHGNTAAYNPTHIQVVNNTFVDFVQGVLQSDTAGGNAWTVHGGLVFWNNIVVDASEYPIYSGGPAADVSDLETFNAEHNCYHGGGSFRANGTNYTLATWKSTVGQDSATGAGGASITTDPAFTNEAGGVYTLGAGSPCLSLGVDRLNLQGGGTTASIHAGCYVTGTETMGVE